MSGGSTLALSYIAAQRTYPDYSDTGQSWLETHRAQLWLSFCQIEECALIPFRNRQPKQQRVPASQASMCFGDFVT